MQYLDINDPGCFICGEKFIFKKKSDTSHHCINCVKNNIVITCSFDKSKIIINFIYHYYDISLFLNERMTFISTPSSFEIIKLNFLLPLDSLTSFSSFKEYYNRIISFV